MRILIKRSKFVKIFLLLFISGMIFFGGCGQAKTSEWVKLDKKIERLYRQGRFKKAVIVAQKALEVAEKDFGPDHPNVAKTLGDLAWFYDYSSNYAQAEPLLLRRMAILEKTLGPDKKERLAQVLYGLGEFYTIWGKSSKAKPFYERSWTIKEKLFEQNLEEAEAKFGPDDWRVRKCVKRLGDLYRDKKDYAKAEQFYEREFSIFERTLSPEDPTLVRALEYLSVFYKEKGDDAKTALLKSRSLVLKERGLKQGLKKAEARYGLQHPGIAFYLRELADFYRDQKDYNTAEQFYGRLLAILEKAQSPDDPNWPYTLRNAAFFYEEKGDIAKAEELHKRSLVILEERLGPRHLEVSQSLLTLAAFYRKQADYAKAEPLTTRALSIKEKAFGPNSTELSFYLYELAELYVAQGNYAKAEPLLERRVTIVEKAFGRDAPEVINKLSDLAEFYKTQGDHVKADSLLKRVLTIQEKAAGLKKE